MTDTSALENLKYAHACDVALDLSSQDVHELWGEIETRDERIAELEAAQRWRVVADGELPEHDGEYWVWLEAWNTPHKRGACIYSKDYHDNNGFFNLIPVTHWMPLPQPPEERER